MSDFWNSFNNGFMFGMLSSNPFFGGLNGFCRPSLWSAPLFTSFFSPTCLPPLPSYLPLPFNPIAQMIFSPQPFGLPNALDMSSFSPMPISSGSFDNSVFDLNINNSRFDSFSLNSPFDTFTYTSQNSSTTNPSSNATSSLSLKKDSVPTKQPERKDTSLKSQAKQTAKTTQAHVATPDATRVKPIADTTVNSSVVTSTKSSNEAEQSRAKSLPPSSNLTKKTWVDYTDAQMQQIYGNYNRDIRTPYKGSATSLNKYLKGKGKLEGCGQAFMDAQAKYGISASVLIGICINESDGGKSKLARDNNNFCGVRTFPPKGQKTFADGKKWHWKKFSSPQECINYVANMLKTKYITPPEKGKVASLTKLYQINAKYCPVSDPTDSKNLNKYWARNVNKFASEVERVS